MRTLVADPRTTVAIVSGRSREDLDRWFAGVPGLSLAAEHGAIVRHADGVWQAARTVDPQTWKPRVRAVLEHFADRTPGSFIEEKEFSLVWHYRMADPIFAEWIANELIATLNPALAETEFVAQRGNKIVEVKLLAANKGEVLSRLQTGKDGERPPDFLLFAGDDQTDEDLFATLPESAWTIHVGGNGKSRARFRLESPEKVGALLQRLAASMPEESAEAAHRHQAAT